MADQSTAVMVWWVTLAALSVGNLFAWVKVARRCLGDADPPDERGFRRRQVILSGLFAFGCAFRSFWPCVEGERFCLSGSWISNPAVARAVATVAELSMVTQWSLVLARWAQEDGARTVERVARALVPMIAIAEVCSWYSALTTNFFGSVLEESIWAATATLLTVSLVVLFTGATGRRRTFAGVAIVFNAAYVVFMCSVDVPMYALRWRRDEARAPHYLSVWDGLRDSVSRCLVTRRWSDWREEIAWMTLYFTVGVWISISLVRAPLRPLPSPGEP